MSIQITVSEISKGIYGVKAQVPVADNGKVAPAAKDYWMDENGAFPENAVAKEFNSTSAAWTSLAEKLKAQKELHDADLNVYLALRGDAVFNAPKEAPKEAEKKAEVKVEAPRVEAPKPAPVKKAEPVIEAPVVKAKKPVAKKAAAKKTK